jgi:glycerophosphoryl diester phosphodiesterase
MAVCLSLLLSPFTALTVLGDDVREAANDVRQIIAHRGSSTDRPENTLAAARRAIEAGATAIETDVRTTRDGHLIILHDAAFDRTTNGTGRVSERTLAEIRKFDAGSWFAPEYAGQRVPTLAEILSLCRESKVDVLLDLKEQGAAYAEKVAAEVRAQGDPRRTIVGVRSIEQAGLFRKLLPESRQLGLIARPELVEPFAEAGVETIRLWPRWLDDETLVPRVRAAGAKLHLNGTTGTLEETRRLLQYRPQSLLADDPGQLVKSLKELRGDAP